MAKTEIERKFLVKNPPDKLEQFKHQEVIQGYLAIEPNGTEVRLRKAAGQYTQTVKKGSGLVRDELEYSLSKKQFNAFWQATEGRRVEKTLFLIPFEDKTIELNVYHQNLSGLLTAEVEFVSLKESQLFKPPSWFGKEVTEDSRYKTQNLASFGSPKD